MIWAALGLIGIGFILVLMWPLYRKGSKQPGNAAEARLQIYRDQLHEIDREAEQGLMAPAELDQARIEIQRRMLALDLSAPDDPPVSRKRWQLAVPLAAVVLAGSAALYLQLGAPDAPDEPFAAREQERKDETEIASALDRLKAHLQATPDDAQGWALYARSLRQLERADDAVLAYEQALKTSGGDPELASELGETLIGQANGTVTPRALALFKQAASANPSDPRAGFYKALAKEQSGDRAGALADFKTLAETAPADAPWLTVVDANIADLSQQLGLPIPTPRTPTPRAAPGPSQGDVAAAANMSGEDQQKMIRGMVAKLDQRLKDHPDDPDGWQRLGKAYSVLGEADKSLNAYREAAVRAPTRIELQLDYAHALFGPGAVSTEPPPEFVELMRHILTLDADQPEALWFVGRAEAASGHGKDAVALLTRLLGQLPPDAPVRGTVQKAIEQAKGS